MVASRSNSKALLQLPVKSNMKFDPPTASLEAPISEIVDAMMEEDVGAVIIVDDDSPVGIITEKDILGRVVKAEKDFETTMAETVMSKPLITIEAERPIGEALEVLRENDIRRLVVTDGEVLLGLITERRLLEVAHEQYKAYRHERIGRVLSAKEVRVNVAYVSTFPPRECGIATYTEDLVSAISRLYATGPPTVIAINDRGGYYDYPDLVKFQIDRDDVESYIRAAEYINRSDLDIVNLQHEYGLFGGTWGEHILTFLEELEKPVVTTLHTVPQEPVPDAERVLRGVLRRSEYGVVMAKRGIGILEQIYDAYASDVRYIPHGCPNVPFVSTEAVKEGLGLEDRIVLSTFGLISRGKGIEHAIRAIPEIVEAEPRVLYLVIGETHPEVRKQEGETYRKYLLDAVEERGIDENVRFVNRFLSKRELIRFLQATDVYVIPYPNRDQISSGTLLYALSTGKAIVSTPFLHAKEVMDEGAAMMCEFKDPESIAEAVNVFLRFDYVQEQYQRRAYQYSRPMIWPNVAMMYVNLFCETLGM